MKNVLLSCFDEFAAEKFNNVIHSFTNCFCSFIFKLKIQYYFEKYFSIFCFKTKQKQNFENISIDVIAVKC